MRMAAKKKIKSNSPLRRRIRRRIRKVIGPKQESLKPAFKDGLIFHSQVRVGKKVPFGDGKKVQIGRGLETKEIKEKSTAIVVTKIRSMKGKAHEDFKSRRRKDEHHKTGFGKIVRKLYHVDELPQIISVLKGDLKLAGMRPLPKQDYRLLSPELKRIYDEVGPGLLGLVYVCKSKNPTMKEYAKVAKEFYEMWKKNKAKAYLVFGKKALAGSKGREIPTSGMRKE